MSKALNTVDADDPKASELQHALVLDQATTESEPEMRMQLNELFNEAVAEMEASQPEDDAGQSQQAYEQFSELASNGAEWGGAPAEEALTVDESIQAAAELDGNEAVDSASAVAEVADSEVLVAPEYLFRLSPIAGKSFDIHTNDLGEAFRRYTAAQPCGMAMLDSDGNENVLVSGSFVNDGSVWSPDYSSPEVERLAAIASKLQSVDGSVSDADLVQLQEELETAMQEAAASLGIDPENSLADDLGDDENLDPDANDEVEIVDGLEFLKSGGSLNQYMQSFAAARQREEFERLQNIKESNEADIQARRELAKTNPNKLDERSGGPGVVEPTIGAALGGLAAMGVRGVGKIANQLAQGGTSVSQAIAAHSFKRTGTELGRVMSKAELAMAQLNGLGLKNIVEANADDKDALKEAFLANDAAKEKLVELESNLGSAEHLASDLIKKGTSAGMDPDKVMQESLGVIGGFAERHKKMLDEIHDKNGKTMSERLAGVADSLLDHLKRMAAFVANKLASVAPGAQRSAGPKMG